MTKPSVNVITYIASTPDKVWSALTDPNITQRYWGGGTRIESDWKVGSKIFYRRDGEVVDEHVLLTCEPRRRFSHTFHPTFGEFRNEPPSKVTFEIVPGGDVVRLTMIHDDFQENSAVYRACSEAWPLILSSLKRCSKPESRWLSSSLSRNEVHRGATRAVRIASRTKFSFYILGK